MLYLKDMVMTVSKLMSMKDPSLLRTDISDWNLLIKYGPTRLRHFLEKADVQAKFKEVAAKFLNNEEISFTEKNI